MLLCTKMNGNGNDFLAIDNRSMSLDTAALANAARLLCRRREAVGADGILVVEPSDAADFKMRIFNSDGSEGEMCGNGSRCIARFVFEKGIVKSPDMTFETLAGKIHAAVNGSYASIDLPPVSISGVAVDAPVAIGGESFKYTFLTVGVPHVVIFEEKRSRSDEGYRELGRAVRNRLDLFPNGANVNFAVRKDGKTLDVLTYERGVEDLTLSCGTGSAASVITGLLRGAARMEADVINPGGVNKITLEYTDEETIAPKLEGRTAIAAEISVAREAFL